MPVIEPAIRPPAEAGSFLLQVTTGCSANQCSFCGAYMGKAFKVKSDAEIYRDLAEGSKLYPEERRVFLMDGDALAIKNQRLLPILEQINRSFPKLTRIASYANGYNITGRSDAELRELADYKLKLIYIGLESGSQEILNHCGKRSGVAEMIEAVRKANSVGIKASVIVLLGLGGKKHSAEHVRETITALNQMQPRYLSFLSLMLIPGTPLFEEARRGEFQELSPLELLREAHDIVAGLNLDKTIFRSDHASNHLPLEGRFPADKGRLLRALKMGLEGQVRLKPEFLRGL
ncbi:MAG: radical SAM protein [Firmicutes bacterium]|nr:radical SAM protein [Bacillota bacterium]